MLKEDVIGLNKASDSKSTIYVMNQKSGKVEKRTVKTKWINPSNEAPQKATIEDGANNSKKEQVSPVLKSKDKRDPTDMKATLGKRKRRNNH